MSKEESEENEKSVATTTANIAECFGQTENLEAYYGSSL